MAIRTCQREDCPNPVASTHARAAYCSNACKSASWRARHGYKLHATRKASQTRRSGPSGRQVPLGPGVASWTEALPVLAQWPGIVASLPTNPSLRRHIATTVMHEALPRRQRERTRPASPG